MSHSLSRCAGSGSQNAVGRGVLGGMLAATFIATFLIPMFYVVVADKLRVRRQEPVRSDAPPAGPVRESGV